MVGRSMSSAHPCAVHMVGYNKCGFPQMGYTPMDDLRCCKNPLKMMIWQYPYFRKPPHAIISNAHLQNILGTSYTFPFIFPQLPIGLLFATSGEGRPSALASCHRPRARPHGQNSPAGLLWPKIRGVSPISLRKGQNTWENWGLHWLYEATI